MKWFTHISLITVCICTTDLFTLHFWKTYCFIWLEKGSVQKLCNASVQYFFVEINKISTIYQRFSINFNRKTAYCMYMNTICARNSLKVKRIIKDDFHANFINTEESATAWRRLSPIWSLMIKIIIKNTEEGTYYWDDMLAIDLQWKPLHMIGRKSQWLY